MDSPTTAIGGHRANGRPHRRRRRFIGTIAASLVTISAGVVAVALNTTANAATVGAGSYSETVPAGGKLPSGCGDLTTNPRQFVTSNAPAGPLPTNDWWSSLVFKRFTDNAQCAYSEPLFAHPLVFNTFNDGLGVSYSETPAVGPQNGISEYAYSYNEDVRVGVTGLNAPAVKADSWSDWTVTPIWSDDSRTLKATIGRGLPFTYYEATGGAPQITARGGITIWSNNGPRICFNANGKDYVAFAPTDGSWSVAGNTITGNLNGKDYFSVAALPTTSTTSTSDRDNLAGRYAQYAYNWVTGTRMSYAYDQSASTITTTYAFTTTAKEGTGSGTVMALYPHQWKYLTGSTPTGITYVSPRGPMKVVTGTQFRTSMKYAGVLPEVPAVGDGGGADLTTITNYLNAELGDPMKIAGTADTYWTGKGLGRAARIAEVADQLSITSVRDAALNSIRTTLTDWFTASPDKATKLFYYDKNWGALIGYPAGYGSDQELNDHHFHYGYFVAAAATLAKFDPDWATSGKYGGMVDMLIRDANNYDRNDARFPYLRDFDIYAGHDWASGHSNFSRGNNQESSSEGINFANGLIQWGQATGNTAVRDAGIFMYTTQSAAIQQYWFDVDNTTFPANWHNYAGIVWGSGASFSTWFSDEREMIYGINMLPTTGGHLYMGAYPAKVRQVYDEMVTENGGAPTIWKDILWQFRALGDPDAALASFHADAGYTPEEGESKAHTFHWLRNLSALGTVDATVTANHPLAKVFAKNGATTYVASNITANALTVTFSDGRTVSVPAGKTVAVGAVNWSGGNATGGAIASR